MYRINHNDAIELEHQVRRLFKCDRAGVSGLADADNFESRPMDAAVMVVSYIHAKGLQSSETQYDEFLCKYDVIFVMPESNRKQAARYGFCILQPACVGGGFKSDCGSIDKLI